jgi:kumamolisin
VTIDLQWAHAMAPRATICVVEAPSDSPTDLFAAVAVASQCVAENGGGEVSMSWGFSEASGETAFRQPLYPERGRLFHRCWRLPGGIVSLRLSQCRRRRRHQPGAQSAAVTRQPGRFPRRGRVELGTHRRYRRPPQPLRAPPRLSVPGQQHRRKLAGHSRPGGRRRPLHRVWIYDTNLSGWLVVGGTSVSTPVWAGVVNAAGRVDNSTRSNSPKSMQAHRCSKKLPEGSRT